MIRQAGSTLTGSLGALTMGSRGVATVCHVSALQAEDGDPASRDLFHERRRK